MVYSKYIFSCVMIMMVFLISAICVGMASSSTESIPVISVRVLDMSGKPLSGIKGYAQVIILRKDGSTMREVGIWEKIKPSSDDGRVNLQNKSINTLLDNGTISIEDGELGYKVFLVGKDVSPTIIQTPIKSFPENIKMDKSVQVIIKLAGETTSGNPKIVPADNTCYAISNRTLNFIDLEKIGKNKWKCALKNGDRYVIGWLSDKLYGYQSEPFTASEGLELEFSPGMSATFEYDLTNSPQDIQVFPAEVSLLIKIINNGSYSYLNWRNIETVKKPDIIKIKGLAGGLYQIMAYPQKYNAEVPFLHDTREIILKPGLVNRFEAVYPIIDKTIEKGDVVIEGTIYNSNLKPVPNKTVRLTPMDDDGRGFNLYYPPSVTDNNGKFKFVGIRPNMAANIKCGDAHAFLGKESFSENAVVSVNLMLGTKKSLGDTVDLPMPDIFIKWKDNSNIKLTDFKGKVIVVDFWATWCPPCKRALTELDVLAKEDLWKKDVVFIALSLDQDYTIWKKTIEKCNWNSLRSGWFDREKNTSVLSKPLPYSLIIDTNGMIRSAGNGIDIEHELNRIVNNN